MKAWASTTLTGAQARQNLVRLVLGLVLVVGLVWALPVRRGAEDGGHHAHHEAALDLFERAGVTELREGQHGPPFRLALLSGGQASLDTWRDKLVVLNFWATWCTPCTVEMPTLEALSRDYRDRGLVVVGISVDRGAPRPVLEPYVRTLGLTFPLLLDPNLETANAWRVTGVPATFIIKPDGVVAGMAFGAREWNSADMKALLDSMLKMGGPDMAPQSTWGPRYGPQTPSARRGPAQPGPSSVMLGVSSARRDGPAPRDEMPPSFPSKPPSARGDPAQPGRRSIARAGAEEAAPP